MSLLLLADAKFTVTQAAGWLMRKELKRQHEFWQISPKACLQTIFIPQTARSTVGIAEMSCLAVFQRWSDQV